MKCAYILCNVKIDDKYRESNNTDHLLYEYCGIIRFSWINVILIYLF